MKTAALDVTVRQQIRARAQELGLARVDDAVARQIAAELRVDSKLVSAELAAVFDGAPPSARAAAAQLGTTTSSRPVASAPRGGARALDLLATSKAMGSARPWNPVARLPPALQARLSDGDRAAIDAATAALQEGVRAGKLEFVPVFGYLSLRTHNFAELGKTSQDEVVHGRDVVDATLPGFDIDVVASSVFRGTPEHPGAVAGLGKKDGATTPGAVLKLPLARAEELLSVVMAREMFAEGDLKDGVDASGRTVSNAMYKPVVETVTLADGKKVPALVFVTNDDGQKAVNRADAFGDGKGLTVERMARLFAAQGGFVNDEGKAFGGPTLDYWQKSYVEARQAAGQPVDPKIAAAIDLSRLHPQEEVVDRLLARTDRDAKLMLEALRHLFQGAASPLGIQRAQKDGPDTLQRTRVGSRGDDAPRRLLERARELERAGKISVD